MQDIHGVQFERFIESLSTESPVSIRINPKKTKHLPELERVAWCDTGYYLPQRPQFTLDPLLHGGTYYVQEASSMFVEQAIKQLVENKSGLNILDLCAAPGGKSTHLLSLFDESCLLVSNELVRSRANILHENICKWGYPNVVVTNNAPKDFSRLPAFFDIVLVDAPCSGEGMFRKDSNAVQEWSEANVRLCAERQRDILTATWASLKNGGLLIYSTCTYNRLENEENADWIVTELGATPERLKLEDSWGVTESSTPHSHGYHFYPHITKGEGFFLSAFKKEGVIEQKKPFSANRPTKITPLKQKNEFTGWLKSELEWNFSTYNNFVKAVVAEKAQEVALVEQRMYIVGSSVTLGEVKGKDFVPSPSLALSTQLAIDHTSTVELRLEEAIRYLRRDAIDVGTMPKGYLLVTYKGTPLGWVKNIGTRSNNLYPNEWRIRMQVP